MHHEKFGNREVAEGYQVNSHDACVTNKLLIVSNVLLNCILIISRVVMQNWILATNLEIDAKRYAGYLV